MATLPEDQFFRRIIGIQFFTALSWSLLSVVFPVLLKEQFKTDQAVSTLYTLFNVVSLVTFFICVPVIRRLHQRRSFDLSLLMMPVFLVAIALSSYRLELAILYAIFTFFCNIYVFNLDLYIPRLQKKEDLMASTGKLGAIYNAAWVVGPFVGSLIAEKSGNPQVFFASAAVAVIAFAFVPARNMPRATIGVGFGNPLAEVRKFMASRFRIQAFINGLGINFIYGSWFLLPLILINLKVDIRVIGLISGLVAIPWVLLEIPIGRLVDKKFSSRLLFTVGYAVMAVTTILMGNTTNVIWFSIFYLLAVIGSCAIEQTNTPYLVKSLDKSELGLISIYLIKSPLGSIIAPLLATFLLTFFSLGQVVTIFGALIFVFVVNALLLPKEVPVAN